MAKKKEALEQVTLDEAFAEEKAAILPTAEELEALAQAKEEAQKRVEAAQAELAEAKAALKALTGRKTVGTVNRGPSGVGNFIKGLITEGKTNQEILDAVATEWPNNFTNTNCINWYRNALKNWPNGKRPGKTKVVEATETVEAQADVFESDEAA